ncbi:MAG TPA: hypothetical protein PLK99_10140, partial [Burkholderiales bacterium]|nr:hypothetical protein [Burkholderiales bacterium]
QAFEPAGPGGKAVIDAIPDTVRIVFVDGRYCAEQSVLPHDEAVKVSPLGLEEEALHRYFGKSMKGEVFAQLNLRNFEDCAFVHVTGEAKQPIHVLHVSTKREVSCALYARCLVVLEANAKATLIEEYRGEGANFV